MAAQRMHRTRIRRRHGLTLVSCTCGWSEEAVSNFGAWLASRRHVDDRVRNSSSDWSLLTDQRRAGDERPLGRPC